jgi:hypothetical protein
MREANIEALAIASVAEFAANASSLAALALQANLPTVCEWHWMPATVVYSVMGRILMSYVAERETTSRRFFGVQRRVICHWNSRPASNSQST